MGALSLEGSEGGRLDWAMAGSSYKEEPQSGDLGLVLSGDWGFLVAVMDGLGHGSPAAAASAQAAFALRAAPDLPLASLIDNVHHALARSRGAVMSLALIREEKGGATLSWAGIGNVEGSLFRAESGLGRRETLLVKAGILGVQPPAARVSSLPLHPGDLLMFATDGMRLPGAKGLSLHRPLAELAGDLHAHYSRRDDDALVLLARWNGPRSE